jgi:hypothetical protein
MYRTDHLFLLVGTNPLPNWVAAQLLLAPGGTLHLIYSDETFTIAQRLRKHLDVSLSMLRVNPADGQDIARRVRRSLDKVSGSVGLHYTGGTKAMAVHAYRAVEQAGQNRNPKPVFSYLDAGTFTLRFDPDGAEEVLFAVRPTLEDLAALHGTPPRRHSPQREAELWGVATATALAQNAPEGSVQAWQAWCDTLNTAVTQTPGESLAFPDTQVLRDVFTALRQDLGLATTVDYLPPELLSELKYQVHWFNGDWLEHYVLAQLLQIVPELHIHDYGMSLATDQRPGKSDFDFEFDVAAMRGYQLFGITCTTSDRKDIAKHKLFEAYIRARQLGGDEARVGLVCAYEDVYRFEDEVMQKWLAKGKIKVFGPQEWPALAAYLKAWFETAQ